MYYDGRDFNDNGCLDSVSDRTARFQEKRASQEEIYSHKQYKPIVFCEHSVQAVNPVTDLWQPVQDWKAILRLRPLCDGVLRFPYKASESLSFTAKANAHYHSKNSSWILYLESAVSFYFVLLIFISLDFFLASIYMLHVKKIKCYLGDLQFNSFFSNSRYHFL